MNISPCGMSASPQDWACWLLAATRLASGFEEIYLDPSRRGLRPSSRMRGDGAPKSAKSLWLVPCGTRAPSGAPITAVAASGPAFVRSVARECADRSVSQLLAGTPSGPGGSSNAARVPRCDEARRRRTPSRLKTPHETPLTGRSEADDTAGAEGGDKPKQIFPPPERGRQARSSAASRIARKRR